MHFHLPKPLHGWREFAGEVGIIVIGVLIALGAEQVVETIHWRHSVSQMREAMRSELVIDRTRVEVNLAQDGCINARLDAWRRVSKCENVMSADTRSYVKRRSNRQASKLPAV